MHILGRMEMCYVRTLSPSPRLREALQEHVHVRERGEKYHYSCFPRHATAGLLVSYQLVIDNALPRVTAYGVGGQYSSCQGYPFYISDEPQEQEGMFSV